MILDDDDDDDDDGSRFTVLQATDATQFEHCNVRFLAGQGRQDMQGTLVSIL